MENNLHTTLLLSPSENSAKGLKTLSFSFLEFLGLGTRGEGGLYLATAYKQQNYNGVHTVMKSHGI